MKKLALAFGILVSVSSVSMGAMSQEEGERAVRTHNDCLNDNKSACQALIDSGLFPSVGQCDKESCGFVGKLYVRAGRYREAIPYFEKAIALGDNYGYSFLALAYDELQDYYNAKKYYEIACNLGDKRACSKIKFMRALDMAKLTPEYQKLELESKKRELEMKKLELERLELEQKLQKYR